MKAAGKGRVQPPARSFVTPLPRLLAPRFAAAGAKGVEEGAWQADWRHTQSTKCVHLLARLREVGAAAHTPSLRLPTAKAIVYTQASAQGRHEAASASCCGHGADPAVGGVSAARLAGLHAWGVSAACGSTLCMGLLWSPVRRSVCSRLRTFHRNRYQPSASAPSQSQPLPSAVHPSSLPASPLLLRPAVLGPPASDRAVPPDPRRGPGGAQAQRQAGGAERRTKQVLP